MVMQFFCEYNKIAIPSYPKCKNIIQCLKIGKSQTRIQNKFGVGLSNRYTKLMDFIQKESMFGS